MNYRTFGKTGLTVSRLGVGMSEIGYELTQDDVAQAGKVLNNALDWGVNLLDTAACYAISEELLGATVATRRDEFILATKAGHVAGGYQGESWTAATIRHSIDRSLTRMRTDYLDIVQLHSCDVATLERGEVIEALQAARQAGKTRFIGYSGDNEAALWAVQSGYFDTLQTSFNLTDQQARYELLTAAKTQEMGVIAKRPIANAVWRRATTASGYARQYWERAQEMERPGPLTDEPDNPIITALGFTLAHEAVDVAIVGTKNPNHLKANITWLDSDLPISPATVADLHARFDEMGESWRQLT
ncbi:MAG: aldo/keto reductase [Caldilineaceae bacterium]|nr:aldo/keto reductase [Caldilineaceae bacterium]